MFLYTEGAMIQLGDVSPAYMVSTIMGSIFSTNEAFANSEIPLSILPSYIALVSLWIQRAHSKGFRGGGDTRKKTYVDLLHFLS